MKLIKHTDIINLNISPSDCISWVNEMLVNKSKVVLPPKTSLVPKEGAFCNVMPTIINFNEKKLIGGIKFVTRFSDREPSLDSKLVVFDADSGNFLAMMDANWITAMRTGAVAAHSINLFSVENYSSIGILGLGNTARTTLLCLSEFVKDKNLKIKLLKYKGQEELFKERFSEFSNFEFEYVDNYDDLVVGSDVVISAATYFEKDICSNESFKEGITVIPVHTRGFGNCDLFFDKVFADDTGHVKHFKYFDKFKQFAEVSDVINKKSLGRENNRERILVYNIGIAMHDINFAYHIYDLINKDNLQDISFDEPVEKFWI